VKAVVYKGPFEVAVENVADPRIEQPLDAVIRITSKRPGPASTGSPWEPGAPYRSTSPVAPAATAPGVDLRVPAGQPVGQAEYLRVPWADFNLLKLPAGTEHENDFTMLSDIFPTEPANCPVAQGS
jgi:glutathione-independent formaldehyde dehydrogenase